MRARLWNPFVGNPEGDASAFESTPGHIHVARRGGEVVGLLSAAQPGNERWNMGEGPILPLFLSSRVGAPRRPPGVITSKQSKRDPCHLKINIFFFLK